MLTKKETRALLILALPLVISGLVEASLGFSSTLFLSHLGAKLLAAGSLVGWFFATLMIVSWGLFSAVSVSVSRCHGAKDELGIACAVRDGFWLAVIIAVPISFLIWHMATVLRFLGQSEELVRLAVPYLHALTWSVVPDFLGILLLQLVIGLGYARTNLVFTLSWVVLNVAANYVFIFGCWGFPALGIAGLGWGTSFSFWVTTVAWFIYLILRKRYRPYFHLLLQFKRPYYFLELLKVGLPTGLMWCIEVSFFFVMSLLIGRLSVDELAATQVSMQYVSLFVSVLFSIAQALTVRVSNRLGAKDLVSANNAVHVGLVFAFLCMLLLAIVAWLFPDALIAIDFSSSRHTSAEVIDSARVYLSIGVGFLLLESIRITLFGALRGLMDTRSTLIASLIGFWLLATPIGWLYATRLGLGAAGYWLGLLTSGFFSAGFLWWRYCQQYRKIQLGSSTS